MSGRTVSDYRILLEEFSNGSVGVASKAIDVRPNRFVALKFSSPTLTKDADRNARFIQEAQVAPAFDRPNICTIHAVDRTPNRERFLTRVELARTVVSRLHSGCGFDRGRGLPGHSGALRRDYHESRRHRIFDERSFVFGHILSSNGDDEQMPARLQDKDLTTSQFQRGALV